MSLGTGLLLATAVLQLAAEAVRAAGPALAAASLLLGAGTFSAVNARLEGAARRKRCGECVAQPSEAEAPGSGAAIALGTALDAVPEALVLGLALREGAVPVALIAIAVGNLPEALSGAAGMRAAGRSYGYVFAVWGGIAAGATVATAAAYLASAWLGAAWPPPLQAFAAGALWAMTVPGQELPVRPAAEHDEVVVFDRGHVVLRRWCDDFRGSSLDAGSQSKRGTDRRRRWLAAMAGTPPTSRSRISRGARRSSPTGTTARPAPPSTAVPPASSSRTCISYARGRGCSGSEANKPPRASRSAPRLARLLDQLGLHRADILTERFGPTGLP